ncbi:hypothetical protein [Algicola sagamiensis]|uniref:hypothetical protein n=1 Tax=Algicola sagamiensis TaxID=163869 RepID=UPI00037EF94C|nr:hypothetical protein [Algicola sagamiensis]
MLYEKLKRSHILSLAVASLFSTQTIADDRIIFPDSPGISSFYLDLDALAERSNGAPILEDPDQSPINIFRDLCIPCDSYPATPGFGEAKDAARVSFRELNYEHFPRGFVQQYNVSWDSLHDSEKMLSLGREWRREHPVLFEAQKASLFEVQQEHIDQTLNALERLHEDENAFVRLPKILQDKQNLVIQRSKELQEAQDNLEISEMLDPQSTVDQYQAEFENAQQALETAKIDQRQVAGEFFEENRNQIIRYYHQVLARSATFQDAIAYRIAVSTGDIEEIEKKTGSVEGGHIISPYAPWTVASYTEKDNKFDLPGPAADFDNQVLFVRTAAIPDDLTTNTGLAGEIEIKLSTRATIHEMLHPILHANDAINRPGLVVHVTNLVMRDLYPHRDIETYWRATY